MVIDTEKILETLVDLERSRLREKNLRQDSEAFLNGLRGINNATDHKSLFSTFIQTLHDILEFEEAFILSVESDNSTFLLATTSSLFRDLNWNFGSVFQRALRGKPIATFNINKVHEWKHQPAKIKSSISSALHIGLKGGNSNALLILTHSKERHFGSFHIKIANRFAPVASQALLTLELQMALTQRDRFFQLSMDLMGIIDYEGDFIQASKGWRNQLGYDPKLLIGESFYNLVHQEDKESFLSTMDHLHESGDDHLIEVRIIDKYGTYRWLSCSLATYKDENLCYLVARDVTDRIIFEQGLAYAACHDSLTGLYNRSEFMDRIDNAFARFARKPDHQFGILFLDLNKFKEINDSFGHDTGDQLLKHFAHVLHEVVREIDTIARLGGDEFAILLENVATEDDAIHVALRIHEKLLDSCYINGHEIHAETSIGICLSNEKYKEASEMLKIADRAMYKTKYSESLQYVIGQ